MKRTPHIFYFVPPVMALVFLVLAACQTVGLAAPQTFDEKAAYAAGNVAAVNEAATTSLTAKKITVLEAQQVRSITYNASELLRAADTLHKAGNDAAANVRIQAVTALLNQLQAYVLAASAKPPINPSPIQPAAPATP